MLNIFDRFGSFQILCTIRPDDHRIEPGTAIQCKTKDSSCHRQSSVRFWSGIRAAKSLVFCVVFYRSLFINLSFFCWSLHCMPFFELWLPITFLASTKLSYLLTYTCTTMLSKLPNLFDCSIYVNIYERLQVFGKAKRISYCYGFIR
jgi:hypothetical protein